MDEAGRGPVLGPLVVGAVAWSSPNVPGNLAIEDSKKLSKSQRLQSREYITSNCAYSVSMIPAWTIDRSKKPLQRIEADVIAKTVYSLEPDPVICDALGNDQGVKHRLEDKLPRKTVTMEPSADVNYSGVSAASILAKTYRDRAMEHFANHWGKVGSGYPSDPNTQNWLENFQRDEPWPPFVRTSWNTVKRLDQIPMEEMLVN
ncbi:MAG: ribonuclease HII [bacterium]